MNSTRAERLPSTWCARTAPSRTSRTSNAVRRCSPMSEPPAAGMAEPSGRSVTTGAEAGGGEGGEGDPEEGEEEEAGGDG